MCTHLLQSAVRGFFVDKKKIWQQDEDHEQEYQILISDEAEDEAIDRSELILSINQVKHGQHPL